MRDSTAEAKKQTGQERGVKRVWADKETYLPERAVDVQGVRERCGTLDSKVVALQPAGTKTRKHTL